MRVRECPSRPVGLRCCKCPDDEPFPFNRYRSVTRRMSTSDPATVYIRTAVRKRNMNSPLREHRRVFPPHMLPCARARPFRHYPNPAEPAQTSVKPRHDKWMAWLVHQTGCLLGAAANGSADVSKPLLLLRLLILPSRRKLRGAARRCRCSFICSNTPRDPVCSSRFVCCLTLCF